MVQTPNQLQNTALQLRINHTSWDPCKPSGISWDWETEVDFFCWCLCFKHLIAHGQHCQHCKSGAHARRQRSFSATPWLQLLPWTSRSGPRGPAKTIDPHNVWFGNPCCDAMPTLLLFYNYNVCSCWNEQLNECLCNSNIKQLEETKTTGSTITM